jgi:hypothetical protein
LLDRPARWRFHLKDNSSTLHSLGGKVMRRSQILKISATALLTTSLLTISQANAQWTTPGLRFKTMFAGTNKCLDIINDGLNNQLIMANCGNYSGQYWQFKITPYSEFGYFQFQSMFAGINKCLDIANDGFGNRLIMTNCGNYSGQYWQLERIDNTGYFRMKNLYNGSYKCLDIINDGLNNKLTMAPCGNYSGQYWTLAVF